jgi:hypothetical protein
LGGGHHPSYGVLKIAIQKNHRQIVLLEVDLRIGRFLLPGKASFADRLNPADAMLGVVN